MPSHKKKMTKADKYEVTFNERQWKTLFNLSQQVMNARSNLATLETRVQMYLQNTMDQEDVPSEYKGITLDAEKQKVIFTEPDKKDTENAPVPS